MLHQHNTTLNRKKTMLLQKLEKRGLIQPPAWLPANTMYLTIMGSHAYGVADTSVKDYHDV